MAALRARAAVIGRGDATRTIRFVIHGIRNLDASDFLLLLAKADTL